MCLITCVFGRKFTGKKIACRYGRLFFCGLFLLLLKVDFFHNTVGYIKRVISVFDSYQRQSIINN
jgi:hypothetical protein